MASGRQALSWCWRMVTTRRGGASVGVDTTDTKDVSRQRTGEVEQPPIKGNGNRRQSDLLQGGSHATLTTRASLTRARQTPATSTRKSGAGKKPVSATTASQGPEEAQDSGDGREQPLYDPCHEEELIRLALKGLSAVEESHKEDGAGGDDFVALAVDSGDDNEREQGLAEIEKKPRDLLKRIPRWMPQISDMSKGKALHLCRKEVLMT